MRQIGGCRGTWAGVGDGLIALPAWTDGIMPGQVATGGTVSDDGSGSEQELFTISYRAVSLGLPVVTHSGDQFGVVEHVLEVPELDLFDGIVVYTGTGLAAIHPRKNETLARAEMLRVGQLGGWLRFVDADQVEAITPGYVKCTFRTVAGRAAAGSRGAAGAVPGHGQGGPGGDPRLVRPVVPPPELRWPRPVDSQEELDVCRSMIGKYRWVHVWSAHTDWASTSRQPDRVLMLELGTPDSHVDACGSGPCGNALHPRADYNYRPAPQAADSLGLAGPGTRKTSCTSGNPVG
jgi:hypothetical protein